MKQQSITTLPPSPEAERRSRMIKYTIAMSIRVLCIFAMLFAQGWWLVVFAAGAIFLPYVAVVLANVSGPSRDSEVLRPGGLVPTGSAGTRSRDRAARRARRAVGTRLRGTGIRRRSRVPRRRRRRRRSRRRARGGPPHDERGAA